MAGMGPPPKPAGQRARRNAEPAPLKLVQVIAEPQPPLPQLWVNGEHKAWPAVTKHWWKMWGRSPLSTDFTEADWNFLADTALLHARVWGQGELKYLAELRLRVAKFGQTPEDRLRMRIQFAMAESMEDPSPSPQMGGSARNRARARLKAG